MDSHLIILESRYKECELEQYSWKENTCISKTEEEQTGEETEDQRLEKVRKLAAAANTSTKENDIAIVHRLGGGRKQGKIRPIIVKICEQKEQSGADEE